MVAAAGLFGLEHVYPRLGEDHARWKKMIMTISTRRMGMVMMIIDDVLEDQDDHNLSHHDHGDV